GVENLPLRPDPRGAVPLAAVLSDERQADLAEAGFVVVGCRPNRDAAFVVHAPTVHRSTRYDEPGAHAEARAHAALPTQIFLSRAAQFLVAFQAELAVGADADSIRADLEGRLRALMGEAGGEVPVDAVTVEPVGSDQLVIRLRPPSAVFENSVSL